MKTFQSINPANGEVLETHKGMSSGEVDHALLKARKAQPEWAAASFDERAKYFRAAAAQLREREDELSNMMTAEMGKPIAQSQSEVEKCAWVCEYFADHAEEFLAEDVVETDASYSAIRYEPLGIVFAIMPWNFPLWQVFRFAVPSLMAGNVGILKHASNVFGVAGQIQEIFDAAGFPDAVFTNLNIGSDSTDPVFSKVDAVTLTGSVGAGRAVAELAGKHLKPTVLELGGSDPFIVLDDADLDAAIDTGVASRTLNNGQSCIAAKRFIVEDGVYEEFVERFVAKFEALEVGDPSDPSTDIGPLARIDLADELADQVERAVRGGAVVETGGERLTSIHPTFYSPTVLTGVAPGNPAFDEELFGPVATITRAKDVDHAIDLANSSSFGLGSSLWTRREAVDPIVNRIQAGSVFVNEMVKSDPRLPFGGIKDSGYGRELSFLGIKEFVNAKTVWVS